MNPLLVQTLISVAASLLLVLFGALAARGWISQEQATTLSTELAKWLIPSVLAFGVGWYNVRKQRFQQKMIVTAAASPAGTPVKDIVEAAKKDLVDPTIPREEAPKKLTNAAIQDAGDAA
jgi:hypothetical protein